MPGVEESLTRAQIYEKTEELKDGVPEKKSTFNENQSDKKQPSFLQKNVNKRDPPSSTHGQSDKKNLLRVENDVTPRGRSASPRKPALRHVEERPDKLPTPLTADPPRRPRDRSLSPRNRSLSPRKGDRKGGQMGARAESGQEHCKRSRGRSASPKKQPRTEGSRGRANAEARLLGCDGQRGGGRAGDGAEQTSEGKEESGVVRKDTKQSLPGKNRTRSPETKSKRMDEKSLPSKKPSPTASKVLPDGEKGRKATSGETSSSKEKMGENAKIPDKKRKQDPEERMVLNKAKAPQGREQEAADKTRESGGVRPESTSPVKKTPITPGPWKVPSANKATGTTGVAEKRL